MSLRKYDVTKLKLYTYEDSLFCYRAMCIAENKEQAINIFDREHNLYSNNIKRLTKENGGEPIKEMEIRMGLFLEGGGNG